MNTYLFNRSLLGVMLTVVAGLTCLMSCLDQTDFTELEIESVNPVLAIPLLSGIVTTNQLVEEIQENAVVVVNEDGIYAAQFFSDPFIQRKDDIFPKVLLGLPIPILDSVVTLPLAAFQEATLSRATLKGDQMFFILNSNAEEDITVEIKIPNLKKDGKEFSFVYQVPFDGSSPSSLTTPMIELDGYLMEAIEGQVKLVYDARKSDGSRIVLPLSFVRVNAFDFSYIEGQIGQTIVPTGIQSIDIKIEDSLVEGTYKFEDPKIHFDITNSFGIPIGVAVTELFLVSRMGELKQIQSTLFNDIITLSFPSLDQVGQAAVDRITFDKNNSNILDLIGGDIVEIRYNLDIITNPEQDDRQFFLTDSSEAVLDATLDLSFAATIEMVTAEHNAPVQLGDIDTLSEARIKIFVDNGMPLSFFPELSFFSLSGTWLKLNPDDNNGRIEAASADELGNVTDNVLSAIYYTLNGEELPVLAQMDSVQATLSVQSPQEGSHPSIIRPGQILEFGIGIEARLR